MCKICLRGQVQLRLENTRVNVGTSLFKTHAINWGQQIKISNVILLVTWSYVRSPQTNSCHIWGVRVFFNHVLWNMAIKMVKCKKENLMLSHFSTQDSCCLLNMADHTEKCYPAILSILIILRLPCCLMKIADKA